PGGRAEGVDRGAAFGVGDGQLQLDTVGVAGQVEDLLQLAVGQPIGSLRCRGHGRLPLVGAGSVRARPTAGCRGGARHHPPGTTLAPPRGNHPLQVMPAPGRSARLPGTPGSRDLQTRTVSAMSENSGLSVDERAELERLRSENAALRARAGRGGAADRDTVRLPSGRSAVRQRWRTVVATLLIVVACVLAPLSVVAVWTRNQVTNTDRYVATVSPLASDPAIQQAIADQITAQVFTYIDIKGLTDQVVEALGE